MSLDRGSARTADTKIDNLPPGPDARELVLEGATLIDGSGAPPVQDAVVTIRADRIIDVVKGPAARPIVDQVRRMDLRGKFLIPGLIDAHVHVDLQSSWEITALLASGVTTIRNPGARAVEALAPHERTVPELTTLAAGPVVDCPPGGQPGAALASTEDEVRAEVRRQAGEGVDFIKLYNGLPPGMVRAAVEQAHALGVPVIGDLVATSWTDAARTGIDFLCHAAPRHPDLLPPAARQRYVDEVQRGAHPVCRWLELVDLKGPEIREMIDAVAEAEVVVDPTLASLEAMLFAGVPRFHERLEPATGLVPPPLRAQHSPPPTLPPETLDALQLRAETAWQTIIELVRMLHAGGVTLLAGTDAPRPWVIPGASLHRELAMLVQAGLSPMEALRAATGRSAAALGVDGELGAIAPGKRADLVLLDRDPLADIENTAAVRWVMKSGVTVEARQLTARLRL